MQAIRLYEETKKRKKVVEDKVLIEDDIRILRNRLDEKTLDIKKLTNQAMVTNQELMTNDLEIITLKM